jgi:hypothetical protein
MSQPKPPTPNAKKDLKQATQVYLKFLPQMLQAEQDARMKYDPARIQEQQALQRQYGPEQYNEQLAALHQLDPQSNQIRGLLASKVYGDLASGYNLPPEFAKQLQSQIRGSEVAHGNEVGNAAVTAENVYSGNAMLQLYQQHLQNAGNFLSGPTPEQQISVIQPVTPDRASAYVNPSAPSQAAQNTYQNQLAAFQASSGRVSPWLQAAEGIGQAAASYYGGPVAGQAAGAGSTWLNGYFSDERMKENIVAVGFSERGYPIYEFNYKEVPHQRFRGTIAQHILPLNPSAVSLDQTGMWRVDYDKLDIKLEQIPEEALV